MPALLGNFFGDAACGASSDLSKEMGGETALPELLQQASGEGQQSCLLYPVPQPACFDGCFPTMKSCTMQLLLESKQEGLHFSSTHDFSSFAASESEISTCPALLGSVQAGLAT